MKRTFSLTSEQFTGEVLFEFTNDILTGYNTASAEMNEQQTIYMAKYLPRELYEVEAFLAKSNTLKFTETTKEITFEDFWARYFQARPKDNSSKKKTCAKWAKMKKSEQIKAFSHIGKYMNNIPSGQVPKYAETYLNAELWNN